MSPSTKKREAETAIDLPNPPVSRQGKSFPTVAVSSAPVAAPVMPPTPPAPPVHEERGMGEEDAEKLG